MVNIPTTIWIDENGRIVRPQTLTPADDRFKDFTRVESGPILDALRAWVRDGTPPVPADELRNQLMCPTPEEQLARTEFALGWHLHTRGRRKAGERHFLRAGELSPHDWTIRRGTLPIRGLDPMGSPEFAKIIQEWDTAGRPYYAPRPPSAD